MKKFLVFVLCSFSAAVFHLAQAQTVVWKNGHPLVTDPDSITFVQPEMGAQVLRTITEATYTEIHFLYPTTDYQGKPIWMSAQLLLEDEQVASKHIGKMAMYNHYTVFRSDECPTCGNSDLQKVLVPLHFAVVSADYDGFGETGDRVQAYCFGEANARASIDALLAAREWLKKEGYTLSDSIINYGYSQGGQTTVAAIKLSQSEYRGKVHFMKNFAGAGPYNLRLTYRKFLEWEKIGLPAVLPQTIITVNELMNMGLDYKQVFLSPLANNVKGWFISKKFDTDELGELIGSDSIKHFIQPVYMDSTSTETEVVLKEVDKQLLTTGWVPDTDTDIKIYHSMKDDIVAPENSIEMYNFFVNNGVTNCVLDTTSLTGKHMASGTSFAMLLIAELGIW
jgi:hypothetical protein